MPPRTFRLFVSSTFGDLKSERDALQRFVFPRLQDFCLAHGCRFQAVDLRWGISTEAALDQRTMRICLDELRRCQEDSPRPNFLVLLGDRYGWRPLPEEIPGDEFSALIRQATPDVHERLLWSIEQSEGDRGWYRLDTNALYRRGDEWVPGVYLLQARTGRYKDYQRYEREVEQPLREWMIRAARRAGFAETEMVKYTASATHQEILQGALKVDDARGHVFAFFREIKDQEGIFASAADDFAKTYFDVDCEDRLPHESFERLQSLKKSIMNQIGHGNIRRYSVRRENGRVSEDHIGSLPPTLLECEQLLEGNGKPGSLCEDVWRRVHMVIKGEIEILKRKSDYEIEDAVHAEFRQERSRIFAGYEETLHQAEEYLAQDSDGAFLVIGNGGAGKSAFIAHLSQRLQDKLPANTVVLERYIGISPVSSRKRTLLAELWRFLGKAAGVIPSQTPSTGAELEQAFIERLCGMDPGRRWVVFVDGVDQLGGQEMNERFGWVPKSLPANIKLVLSVSSDEGVPPALASRIRPSNVVNLTGISAEEAETVLASWLALVGRTLSTEQRSYIIRKFTVCPLPLYLRLAFEEARQWHSYEAIPGGKEGTALGEDIDSTARAFFLRLCREESHGIELVGRVAGYLCAARYGLTEDEIIDLLSQDAEFIKLFESKAHHSLYSGKIPDSIWIRLYNDVANYLSKANADGSTVLRFYHRRLKESAAGLFLAGEAMQRITKAISQYFSSQSNRMEGSKGYELNRRKLAELPHALTANGSFSLLRSFLSDIDFIEAKVEAFGVERVLEDYEEAAAAGGSTKALDELSDILRLLSQVITTDPPQVAGQILGRMTDIASEDRQEIASRILDWRWKPWLCPLTSTLTKPGSTFSRKFKAHEDLIESIAFFPDGERIVSVSDDQSIRIRDLRRGVDSTCLRGHSDKVRAVALSNDGSRLASGSDDRSILIWDPDDGTVTVRLVGHEGGVAALTYSPDDLRILSASDDGTVRIWDANSGASICVLTGHTDWVRGIAVHPKGDRAVSVSDDGTARVWDLRTFACLSTIRAHEREVWGVAIKEDGSCFATASNDKLIKIWDLRDGSLRRKMIHRDFVRGVYFIPGTVHLLAVSDDGEVLIWNTDNGSLAYSLPGHECAVFAAAVSHDGKSAATGGLDGEIRIWRLGAREQDSRDSPEDEWSVQGIEVFGDGNRIISVSNGGTLRVLNAVTFKPILECMAKDRSLTTVAVSPDGSFAVAGCVDSAVMVFDLATGRLLHEMKGHTKTIRDIVIHPNGLLALSASADASISIWDPVKGIELKAWGAHDAAIQAIALMPDGNSLLSASFDHTIRLYGIPSGLELKRIDRDVPGIWSISVFPDSRRFIAGCDDTTVRIWELSGEEETIILKGHQGPVWGVSTMVEGNMAVSVSQDGTLIVWDTAARSIVAKFSVEGPLNCCAVSRNGVIFAGGYYGKVHAFTLKGRLDSGGK
jgi:NACHT domain- and WD repeat-containing protein